MKKRILTVLLLLLALIGWGMTENQMLTVTPISVVSPDLPEAFEGFRIAHISDLHNAELGKDNTKLLTALRAAAPDIIVFTGDMVDSRRTDFGVAFRLITQAQEIAPCYYVTGNHEARLHRFPAFSLRLEEAGIQVLQEEDTTISRQGQVIRILGINDPAFQRSSLHSPSGVEEWIDKLPDDEFTLVLSHRPEYFPQYWDSGAELVLCGHAHGGQFRLPFIGGILAPGQGLFPDYDAGIYTRDETNMVVSRGLGNSLFPLRYGNPPELVLVTLQRP